MSDPRSEYARRIALWDAAIARGNRIHLLISNGRLATAGVFALLAWLLLGRAAVSSPWILAPILVFAVLAAVHARVLARNERAIRARRLNERGIARLDGRWPGSGPDGARFLDGHPYARDLDLFGAGSLFQLLNAAKTEAGEETLARWLRSPAPIAEASARQAAVIELAPQVEFRETLAVVAGEAHVGKTSALDRWASLPPVGLTPAEGFLFLAVGAITVPVIAGALIGWLTTPAVLGWFAFETVVYGWFRKRVDEVFHRIEAASNDLAILRELLEIVEGATFASPWLAAIHAKLVTAGVPPSKRIARLQGFISVLDQYQHNPYFRFVGTPLLVGGQVAVLIDRWHAAHGREMGRWLQSVGELEAIASLAGYCYEHQSDPFPELVEGGAAFEAEGLAHPLLTDVAVRNDLRLGGQAPHVCLVSGSNMSGKSTLLRAVGINVVLAQAGAPVRASRLRMSPLAIGATLRVVDSLQEGYSRFYAEILRIKEIVDAARGGNPLIFLLDEILHGTNSHDRRIGAQAIVRALVDAGAIGLVTTHDLALTDLVAALGPRAANVHFEDQVIDGRMVFDYRVRPGVVERSNALELMRAIGIDIPN